LGGALIDVDQAGWYNELVVNGTYEFMEQVNRSEQINVNGCFRPS
jgi:hypothetical protein